MQGCQCKIARDSFKRMFRQLLGQLEAVMHHARAARVIAANSRIEASQAGEYLQSLQALLKVWIKPHIPFMIMCSAVESHYPFIAIAE